MNTEPVLITLISSKCTPCLNLMNIWNNVTQSLINTYSKLRFPVATEETKQYKYPPIIINNWVIDSNIYPKDLTNYILWTPITLLIPGDSWNYCNETLGPKNERKLKNVQIMNSKWENNTYKNFPFWDTSSPLAFSTWLTEALNKIHVINISNNILKDITLPSNINNNPVTFLPNKIINDQLCLNVLNLISRQ